jgi:hypothetical protein
LSWLVGLSSVSLKSVNIFSFILQFLSVFIVDYIVILYNRFNVDWTITVYRTDHSIQQWYGLMFDSSKFDLDLDDWPWLIYEFDFVLISSPRCNVANKNWDITETKNNEFTIWLLAMRNQIVWKFLFSVNFCLCSEFLFTWGLQQG